MILQDLTLVLKNIVDAIHAYLETVDELSKEKEARYVEVMHNA